MPDRFEKERKRSSRVLTLAVTLVAVLVVAVIAALIVSIVNNTEPHPSEAPVRTSAGILYNAHTPIYIDGNAGFTTANGVVGGSGTASDPYIIADWDINASTADGIWIGDTDEHFTVRNCYVHDGSSANNDGIYLAYCVNGTLENNDCSNDFAGIALSRSSNTMLTNNNCSSNVYDGILLTSSSNNTLRNNNCSLNFGGGIALISSSNDNMLTNNNCSSNLFGEGMHLGSSNNNTISDNNCSNDYSGIDLFSSSNNTISWNQLYNNAQDGIHVDSGSNNNRIWNNTFIGNYGATDTYDASHIQASDVGADNWWNSTDGYGNYWSDWTTPDAVPPWGIVDHSYNISGSAGAKDYYPLTTTPLMPIPEFGMMPFVVIALLAMIVLAGETRRKKKS